MAETLGSLIDKLSINLIFLINILFFASILNINSKYVLYLYVISIIFLYFFNFRKFNFKSIKLDYYFLVLLSFIILISIDIAHELYFAWDTQVHWFLKVLNFFQNQKFENLENFEFFRKFSKFPKFAKISKSSNFLKIFKISKIFKILNFFQKF